ncbi:hypothetical protein D3C71_1645030 [compost metagenome]
MHDRHGVVTEVRLDAVGHQQIEPIVAGEPIGIDADLGQRRLQLFQAGLERVQPDVPLVETAVIDHLQRGLALDQLQRGAHQLGGLAHQAAVIPADPIPLQHGELRVVAATGLAIAKHAAEFVTVPHPGGEQPLEGKLRRGA